MPEKNNKISIPTFAKILLKINSNSAKFLPFLQSQQLFDCRWHLASLVVQACFGHFFVFCSRSALLFCAAFLASQYAIVYSLLTLIIYTLDTALLMLFPRSSGID